MMTKAGEQPTITQADRDAAAAIHMHYNPKSKQTQMQAARMRSGTFDHDPLVQAFARHRTTSLAAQVDALRQTRDALRKLQPALNVMAREIIDDIIADKIEKALS